MGENRSGWVKRAGFAPVALTAAALLVSACGSGTSTSTSTTTPSSAAAAGAFGATKDAALAAEVPKSLASAGSVTVASDATYPPMESITPGTTTIIGMDPDLGHAIGTVLGLKFDFQNVTFNKILLGLKSGQYDLGMSAFTDEKSREQTVDFVDYFKAGTSFVVRSDSGLNLTSLDQICGMTVAVESGTTEQSDAAGQSKKCTGAGKKAVTVLAYPTQTQANLTLSAGRAQVMMADTPVAAYQVKLSNGKFKLEGAYGVAPYGIAVPKNSGMAKPIQDAINKLIATGVYQKIMTKWGLQSGAITQATINQAVF
jgi:polar amino acid transport system substrate-binding protein